MQNLFADTDTPTRNLYPLFACANMLLVPWYTQGIA